MFSDSGQKSPSSSLGLEVGVVPCASFNSEACVKFQEVVDLSSVELSLRCGALLNLGHSWYYLRNYRKARSCYAEVLVMQGASDEDKDIARQSLARVPGIGSRVLRFCGLS